jgi:hypothetical protein
MQIPDDVGYFPQQQFNTFLVAFDVFWQVLHRAMHARARALVLSSVQLTRVLRRL